MKSMKQDILATAFRIMKLPNNAERPKKNYPVCPLSNK